MRKTQINNTVFERKQHYVYILKEAEILKRQVNEELLDGTIEPSRLEEIMSICNLAFAGLIEEGLEYQYEKDTNPEKSNVILTIDHVDYQCRASALRNILKNRYPIYIHENDTDMEFLSMTSVPEPPKTKEAEPQIVPAFEPSVPEPPKTKEEEPQVAPAFGSSVSDAANDLMSLLTEEEEEPEEAPSDTGASDFPFRGLLQSVLKEEENKEETEELPFPSSELGLSEEPPKETEVLLNSGEGQLSELNKILESFYEEPEESEETEDVKQEEDEPVKESERTPDTEKTPEPEKTETKFVQLPKANQSAPDVKILGGVSVFVNEPTKNGDTFVYQTHRMLLRHDGATNGTEVFFMVAPIEMKANMQSVPIVVYAFCEGREYKASSYDISDNRNTITLPIGEYEVLIRGKFENYKFDSVVYPTGASISSSDDFQTIDKQNFAPTNPMDIKNGHIRFTYTTDGNAEGTIQVFPISKNENSFLILRSYANWNDLFLYNDNQNSILISKEDGMFDFFCCWEEGTLITEFVPHNY